MESAPALGLHGVWIAMAVELGIRGIAFIIKLRLRGWTNINNTDNHTTEENSELLKTDTIYENN